MTGKEDKKLISWIIKKGGQPHKSKWSDSVQASQKSPKWFPNLTEMYDHPQKTIDAVLKYLTWIMQHFR